jgi:hypothetical protein
MHIRKWTHAVWKTTHNGVTRCLGYSGKDAYRKGLKHFPQIWEGLGSLWTSLGVGLKIVSPTVGHGLGVEYGCSGIRLGHYLFKKLETGIRDPLRRVRDSIWDTIL